MKIDEYNSKRLAQVLETHGKAEVAATAGVDIKTITNIVEKRLNPRSNTIDALNIAFPELNLRIAPKPFSFTEEAIKRLKLESCWVAKQTLLELLDPNTVDAVSYCLAKISGTFENDTRVYGRFYHLLETYATILQTSKLSTCDSEVEKMFMFLSKQFPQIVAEVGNDTEGMSIISCLRQAQLQNDSVQRLKTLKMIFYYISNNWVEIKNGQLKSLILNEISVIIIDADDSEKSRRDLFYAILRSYHFAGPMPGEEEW